MRFLVSLFMALCLLACAQDTNQIQSSGELLKTLSDKVKMSYEQDKTIVLFAYEDEIENSEAYADWAAYLNDFNEGESKHFDAVRVTYSDFEKNMTPFLKATEKNFTLFLKKDMPVYYYEGLILEPQVYAAVKQVYQKLDLNDEHRAFLPKEVKLERR